MRSNRQGNGRIFTAGHPKTATMAPVIMVPVASQWPPI
jgi:hypothetical protein